MERNINECSEDVSGHAGFLKMNKNTVSADALEWRSQILEEKNYFYLVSKHGLFVCTLIFLS